MKSSLDELYHKVVVNCTKRCSGKIKPGIVIKDSEFVDCECLERFRKIASYMIKNIPFRYQSFNFDLLSKQFKKENKEQLRIILDYIDKIDDNIENGRGLFIVSDGSAVNTGLACHILIKAIENGHDGQFVSCSELASLCRTFRNDAEEKLTEIRDSRIVCLDNIHLAYVKPDSFTRDKLEDVFRGFYNNQRALIVTSNVPRTELDFPPVELLVDLQDVVLFKQEPDRDQD